MSYLSFDHYLQRKNAEFGIISDSEITEIITRQYSSWRKWRLSPIKERVKMLKSLGDLLLTQKKQHAETITSEMGKPISQALAEVEKCAVLCFYYADHLSDFLSPEERVSSARESYLFYEPQGIILGIMPWNFPYWQALRFIIPTLAGGNGVLLKHASNVPLCAMNIESIISEAGFPKDIFRNLFVGYSQIESIISRPEVRGVSLTGSNVAGKKVAENAGRNLKKLVLELGGSDPFIILPDADIDAAAEAALLSRFQNCGQSCIAAKRLFVHSDIYSDFLSVFSEKVEKIKCGDPYSSDTFIGPMVNENALIEVRNQVIETLTMGARLITGGKRYSSDSPIYCPTIIADVPENSPLLSEEVFGPVIPVVQFSDMDELILKANKTSFGLGASVWTRNKYLAMTIASKIDSGTVAINGFVRSDPALPFGGVKDSGYGRELSVEGFREFLNVKTVSVFG
jgi:succinate-semialdehyde dehydrogenase / glutarate-semialdehyde dehydrogenase